MVPSFDDATGSANCSVEAAPLSWGIPSRAHQEGCPTEGPELLGLLPGLGLEAAKTKNWMAGNQDVPWRAVVTRQSSAG